MKITVTAFGGLLGEPLVKVTNSAREALHYAEQTAATFTCDLAISAEKGAIDIKELGRLSQKEYAAERKR